MPDAESAALAAVSEDHKTVEYVLDERTALSYSLTSTGFKEDIVVSEYTGQTDYGFTLYTGGLELWEQDGSYYLRDESGEVRANIGDVIVFTADEKNNTMGSMSAETVSENEEYRLTIHVDGEYLARQETVYPIRIDPTIEIDEPLDGMQDTTIYSNNGNNTFGNSSSLQVGKCADYGIARTMIRFSMPTFNYIHSSLNVNSAYLELYNKNYSDTNEIIVECYMYEGESWSQSTITWNTANPNYISSCITSKIVSQVEGYHQTPISNRYSFDVSKAVKRWVDARCDESSYRTYVTPNINPTSFDISKGLLLKSKNTENSNTAKYKTFSSSNDSTNKPSLTVNYSNTITRNEYFSKFNPSLVNYTFNDFSGNTYSRKYRSNCYAYSVGFLLDGAYHYVRNNHTGFILEPGSFSHVQAPYNGNLNDYYNNCKSDLETLGYSVSEYISYNSTVAQYGSENRLIAVVDRPGTYHFYMQHNDGTWSHKLGINDVINTSEISHYGNGGNNIIITNENIKSQATEYGENYIRFMVITKTAGASSHTEPPPYPCEITENAFDEEENTDVGEFFETSKKLYRDTVNDKYVDYDMIDSPRDVDVYYFDNFLSKNYTVKIDRIGTNGDVDCALYAGNGTLISSYNSTGNVYFTYSFSGGNQYYLMIYNHNTDEDIGYDYKIEIY